MTKVQNNAINTDSSNKTIRTKKSLFFFYVEITVRYVSYVCNK